MIFRDRDEAAGFLAERLRNYRGTNPLVLAIPRGAVRMAEIIADSLDGDLDVVLVRKLRAPGNPELAIGSMDESGQAHLSDYVRALGVTETYIAAEKETQLKLIRERRAQYTPVRPPLNPEGRVVIVVDDGVATGSTFLAALQAIRKKNPQRLVAAVGVAPSETCERLRVWADEVICLSVPRDFHSVGQFYEDFSQTEDEEVIEILTKHGAREQTSRMHFDGVDLEGSLVIPEGAGGIVIFAHGSGSSRHSPRNVRVARVLNEAGIGTFLFDLLTPTEDAVYETRFDIELLARRLNLATQWLTRQKRVHGMKLGYFGASTGAAAALKAAAARGPEISAVVSRGGRPDLAADILHFVTAPTLLIVGGNDLVVIDLNRMAFGLLRAEKKFKIIPGAGHVFEEAGTLEEVARLSAAWFRDHFERGWHERPHPNDPKSRPSVERGA